LREKLFNISVREQMWVDRAWLHPVLSNTLEFAVEEASSN